MLLMPVLDGRMNPVWAEVTFHLGGAFVSVLSNLNIQHISNNILLKEFKKQVT